MWAKKGRRLVARWAHGLARWIEGDAWRQSSRAPLNGVTRSRAVRFEDLDKARAMLLEIEMHWGPVSGYMDLMGIHTEVGPGRVGEWLGRVSRASLTPTFQIDGGREGDSMGWRIEFGPRLTRVSRQEESQARAIADVVDRYSVPITWIGRREHLAVLPPRSAPDADAQAHDRQVSRAASIRGAAWGIPAGVIGGVLVNLIAAAVER